MIADVYIELKEGVADPEGEATKKALRLLGFNVKSVSTRKVFRIELDAKNREEAEKKIAEMCERLLANPVIQRYSIKWVDDHEVQKG